MDVMALARARYTAVTEAFATRLDALPDPAQTFSRILSSRLGRGSEDSSVLYTSNLPENYTVMESTALQDASSLTSLSSMNMSATSTSADMALKRAQVEPYVEQTAAQYGLPEELIHAVIRAESSYNANSVSSAGAQGLMQLMPATARALGVTNSFDPAQNIDGGANYLRQMLDRFDGDVRLALAAYNCGPARVESLGITSSMDSSSYAKLSSGVRTYVSRVLGFAGVTTA